MANEIRTNVSATVAISGQTLALQGTYSATLASQAFSGRQQITTSWAAIQMPSGISAVKRITFKNEDTTNYVELSYSSIGATVIAKLAAGDVNHICPPAATATVYARANTASCWASFIITQD